MTSMAIMAFLGLIIVILVLGLTIFLSVNKSARNRLVIKKKAVEEKTVKKDNLCINCEAVIPDNALYCHVCGKKQRKISQKKD